MNKKIYLAMIMFGIMVLLISGTTYSVLVSADENIPSSRLSTQNISASLDFQLDDSKKGVPGESIKISLKNTITKQSKGEPIAFKVVYEIEDAQNIDFISNLELRNSSITSIMRGAESTSTKLIYYGLMPETATKAELGDIYAEFQKTNNQETNKSFTLLSEFKACQSNERAINDILGVNPVGEFAFLVQ